MGFWIGVLGSCIGFVLWRTVLWRFEPRPWHEGDCEMFSERRKFTP